MRKLSLIILLVLCMSMLSGCFCKHETWHDATCETPKTCAECGETEGEALGHVWMAATCETPKTCEQCGLTNGEAKGHAWEEATCETPKTCTNCALTSGEALGHDWQDATTENPKTCATCQLTEGDRIITDERFTTASTAALQGKWGIDNTLTAEDLGLSELEKPLVITFVVEFCNDGNLKMYETVADEALFWDVIIDISAESMYAEFAAQGIDRATADQAMVETYGVGIEAYLQETLSGLSINDLMESIMGSISGQGVYYVENGVLYSGFSWESEMDEDEFTVDGDKLYIDSLTESLGLEGPLYRIAD